MTTSRILSAPTLGRALAEVAIIVVGVLIALGADAWWTEREERSGAAEYLDRFAVDLDADREMLLWTARSEERRSEATDALVEWMGRAAPPARDSLRALVNRIREGNLDPVRTGTWTDLVNTGGLALIEDRALREQIVRYHQVVEPNYRYWAGKTDELHTRLFYEMVPYVDDRVLFGHLSGDPTLPVLTTPWDSFRLDPEVLGYLRTVSASAVDNARIFRSTLREAECLRVLLHDAGAVEGLAAAEAAELRERCEEPRGA